MTTPQGGANRARPWCKHRSTELVTTVADSAKRRASSDAVPDTSHRSSASSRIGLQPDQHGTKILGDLRLGRSEDESEHLRPLLVAAALHRIPGLGTVVSVVGGHEVAPLGDPGHRLLRTLVQARTVMKKHDYGERAIALRSNDMEAQRAAGRADCFRVGPHGYRYSPLTRGRAELADPPSAAIPERDAMRQLAISQIWPLGS